MRLLSTSSTKAMTASRIVIREVSLVFSGLEHCTTVRLATVVTSVAVPLTVGASCAMLIEDWHLVMNTEHVIDLLARLQILIVFAARDDIFDFKVVRAVFVAVAAVS